jgi:two-component system, OmpR family, KDP operon response regulator KdpE
MKEKKILIIDDDPHLILGLTPRLKSNGYNVISATDGISAIAVARKEAPDLIILDLGLPGGDGFVVLERMKGLADLGAVPIIVLSARNPNGNEKRALDLGAVAFFQKPPDNHEFLNAVRHALGETIALSTFLKT